MQKLVCSLLSVWTHLLSFSLLLLYFLPKRILSFISFLCSLSESPGSSGWIFYSFHPNRPLDSDSMDTSASYLWGDPSGKNVSFLLLWYTSWLWQYKHLSLFSETWSPQDKLTLPIIAPLPRSDHAFVRKLFFHFTWQYEIRPVRHLLLKTHLNFI